MNNFKECNNCLEDISNFDHLYLPEYELYYHESHFNCKNCDKSLSDCAYSMKENNFYCKECYEILYFPYCEKCKNVINGEYKFINKNKYHVDCLNCFKCLKEINNEMVKMNNKIYCLKCYNYNNILCIVCDKEIKENYFKTEKLKNFHIQCFNCIICKKNIINEENYIERNENIYHEDCYKDYSNKKCYFCDEYIEGVCLKDDNNYFFHKECIMKKLNLED